MDDSTANLPSDPPPSEPVGVRKRAQKLGAEEVALYIGLQEKPLIIRLAHRERASLGRHVNSQIVQPSIDLTAYDAYAQGVSRMHANLHRMEDNSIAVEDID